MIHAHRLYSLPPGHENPAPERVQAASRETRDSQENPGEIFGTPRSESNRECLVRLVERFPEKGAFVFQSAPKLAAAAAPLEVCLDLGGARPGAFAVQITDDIQFVVMSRHFYSDAARS